MKKKVAAASCCAVFMRKRDEKRGNGRRKADGSEVDKTGRVWYNGQTDEILDKTEISVYADGSAPDGRKIKK